MAPLVLAASVRGPSHEAGGRPCEDALGWARLGRAAAVLAVADGAGSASLARAGARAATDGAVAAVCRGFAGRLRQPAALAQRGARAARAALERAAGGGSLRDFACTLLVAVWLERAAAAVHIGDGAAVGLRDEAWLLLSGPAPGEYVNETRFLSDTDWRRHLRTAGPVAGLDGLVLFTDGCQRAALRRPDPGPEAGNAAHEPFAPFLWPLARFARSRPEPAAGERGLAALLDSAKLRAVSDDDKTLALIWRQPRRA